MEKFLFIFAWELLIFNLNGINRCNQLLINYIFLGLVALGVAGGIVAPITAPLAKAAIIKGLIIKGGSVIAAVVDQNAQNQRGHYRG